MPDVPPPDACAPLAAPPVPQARAADHVEHRPARDPLPFAGADTAEILVWMRLGEDRPVDAALATFLVDSAVPALYARLDAYVAMPTVELSVHYAATQASDDPWVLGVFRTAIAADGYASEDGELWTPAGALLVRARQLRRVVGT
jgi:acyl-CoA thioesterase